MFCATARDSKAISYLFWMQLTKLQQKRGNEVVDWNEEGVRTVKAGMKFKGQRSRPHFD